MLHSHFSFLHYTLNLLGLTDFLSKQISLLAPSHSHHISIRGFVWHFPGIIATQDQTWPRAEQNKNYHRISCSRDKFIYRTNIVIKYWPCSAFPLDELNWTVLKTSPVIQCWRGSDSQWPSMLWSVLEQRNAKQIAHAFHNVSENNRQVVVDEKKKKMKRRIQCRGTEWQTIALRWMRDLR